MLDQRRELARRLDRDLVPAVDQLEPLDDVVKGTSKTPVNVVTLKELQSEPASINVHDPNHNQRPLVCADIPQD